MYSISVSEHTLKLLTVLKKWRHNADLDELVADLASKEIPSYHSASLEGGNYDSSVVGIIDIEGGEISPTDRIISDWINGHEKKSSNGERGKSSQLSKVIEPDGEFFDLVNGSAKDFYFTKILSTKINSKPVKNLSWIGITEALLVTLDQLGLSNIWSNYGNWVDGHLTLSGWQYVRQLNISIHRVDAYRSWLQIADIALRYNVSVEIKVMWKEKGMYPRKKGLLRIQPGKK